MLVVVFFVSQGLISSLRYGSIAIVPRWRKDARLVSAEMKRLLIVGLVTGVTASILGSVVGGVFGFWNGLFNN